MFVLLLLIWISTYVLSISETTNCEFNIFIKGIKSSMYLFNSLFCSFTKSKASSIYLMYSFIRDLSNKSLTIVFPNSAMLFASTVQRGSHECSIDLPVVSNVKTECCFCKSVNNQLFHCLRVVVWITLSS